MRTVETKVYTYDELSEKAKERARNWWREGYDGNDAFEWTVDDAAHIGLKITALSTHGTNKGDFVVSAIDCSERILEEHGEDCETYKTAMAFMAAIDALPELPAKYHPLYDKIEAELCDKTDEAEREFLYALLEDYRIMFEREIEHQTSDETIAETLRVCGYEFTEDGRLYG